MRATGFLYAKFRTFAVEGLVTASYGENQRPPQLAASHLACV